MYKCSVLFITVLATAIATDLYGYPGQGYRVQEDRYYPRADFGGGYNQGYQGRPFIKAGIESGGLIGAGNIGYGGGVSQFNAGIRPVSTQGLGLGGNINLGAHELGIRQFGAGGIGGQVGGGQILSGGAGLGAGGGSFGGSRAAFYPVGGHSGGYLDKKVFSDENKRENGQTFQENQRSNGEVGQHGTEGFTQGQVAVKNFNEDSGSFNNQRGDKKIFDDGKFYNGGQQFSEAGGKGEGENQKNSHKKGHSKNGFKTSHHKDETKQEETFYDEAHDEGEKFNHGGNQGNFENNGQSNYKGKDENGQFVADEERKHGNYRQEHLVNNANLDKGQYGQKINHGNSAAYGVNNGAGQQSLLGRQEARAYLDHHPHSHIPFHSEY